MPKLYTKIADRIAERIANGTLSIGTRLPPQRTFAFEEGLAVSTVSRAYEELRRRGLVSGEVGRGTFVANRFSPLDAALQEPSGAGLDLEIVFRLSGDSRAQISESTARFFKAGLAEDAAAPPSVRGNSAARKVLSALTSAENLHVDPETILLSGSGKSAIAASLACLAPRGGRIAVEALTYPFVIAVARRLGIELVPLSLDSEGLEPDALRAEAKRGLNGVYLQPTLQSPLVRTMSQSRRKAVADELIRHNLIAIEDRVYGFLRPTQPIAAHAPHHVIQIDSLSKRLMPGLSLGLIIAPHHLRESLAKSLRTGGWMAPSLAIALAKHWIEDGLVASVEASKRIEAAAMYRIALRSLSDVQFHGAPDALHGWLELPAGWRGSSFAAACAELGIAVASGSVFAVKSGFAPPGVRIACSAPDLSTWAFALQELNRIALRGPQADNEIPTDEGV